MLLSLLCWFLAKFCGIPFREMMGISMKWDLRLTPSTLSEQEMREVRGD